MRKQNCWEYKMCGREPGGLKVTLLGACPAAAESKLDGLHAGKNAGRACWAISGTLCEGKVQGTYAQKLSNCLACEFYQLVGREEGDAFISCKEILGRLKKKR